MSALLTLWCLAYVPNTAYASAPVLPSEAEQQALARFLAAPTPAEAPTTTPQSEVDRVAQSVLEKQRQMTQGGATTDKRRIWAQLEKLRERVNLRLPWGAPMRSALGFSTAISVGPLAFWAGWKIGSLFVSHEQLSATPGVFGSEMFWRPHGKGELLVRVFGPSNNDLYAPEDGYMLEQPGKHIWTVREPGTGGEPHCGLESLPGAVPAGARWLASPPVFGQCGREYPWTPLRTFQETYHVLWISRETVMQSPPTGDPPPDLDGIFSTGSPQTTEEDVADGIGEHWTDPEVSEAAEWMDSALTAQLAEDLQAQNPQIPTATAITIARECIERVRAAQLGGREICRQLPIFAPGSDTDTATQHDIEALNSEKSWVKLNFTRTNSPGWYSITSGPCAERQPDEQCDEFPFLSTVQGGSNPVGGVTPSLKPVKALDNMAQGGHLSVFYNSQCALTVGDPFLVVPIPPALGVPTLKLCNRRP